MFFNSLYIAYKYNTLRMNNINQLTSALSTEHRINKQIHEANKQNCQVCHSQTFSFFVYCNMCGVKI